MISVDATILDLVYDIISSRFLAANSKPIYTRRVRVAKMMNKDEGVVPLIWALA